MLLRTTSAGGALRLQREHEIGGALQADPDRLRPREAVAFAVEETSESECPDRVLHTNGGEGDIRVFVKWRKISGGTRSDLDKDCRDGFASFKKSCRKLGISFWDYLGDRIKQLGTVSP